MSKRFVPAILFALLAMSSAQTPPAPLSITTTAPTSCVKSDSPIELNITMTNTSDHDAYYRVVAFGKWAEWVKILVYDSAGKLALITKENPLSFKAGSVFSARPKLSAGESVHSKVDIAKEWGLTKPDRYRVGVTPLTEEKFKSDVVTVCVTQ